MRDLSYIMRAFFKRRGLLLCSMALTVISCVAEIRLPMLMAGIVNKGVLLEDLTQVRHGGMQMLATVLVMALAGFGAYMTCALASEGFARDLRDALFERIVRLSVGQVESLGSGPLMTRLTRDVGSCASIPEVLTQLLLEPIVLLVCGIWMIWRLSHLFDGVFLVFVVVQCALTLLFVAKTMPLFVGIQRKNDGLNSYLQTELRAVRLIKAYQGEEKEEAALEVRSEQLRAVQLQANRWAALFDPLLMVVVNFAITFILCLSGWMVQAGTVQVGSVLAAVTYTEQVLLSIVLSGKLFSHVTEARACAERVAEVLRMEPEVEDGEKPLTGGVQSLDLRDVSFCYVPGGREILSKIDLSLKRGDFLAVCGCVGCGKTTLARLLCRACDPTSGSVLINGEDARGYRLKDIRRAVAVVEKDLNVIEGTIAHNILYGREDISREALRKAMRTAGVEEMISGLPEGEETCAHSLGTSLSGGDRQRLALARALAGDPSVLVLDDSTSSLDFSTEAQVLRAIRRDRPGIAIVLMTQRVPSVQAADAIVCIGEDGSVETGTVEGLLRSSAVFSRLYRSQGGAAC